MNMMDHGLCYDVAEVLDVRDHLEMVRHFTQDVAVMCKDLSPQRF